MVIVQPVEFVHLQMRLPNLLDHDTMSEVSQQATSWLPLLNVQCHADSQLFLCSLFAPVCLERPIYPCRSLCKKVGGDETDRQTDLHSRIVAYTGGAFLILFYHCPVSPKPAIYQFSYNVCVKVHMPRPSFNVSSRFWCKEL